jgi:hypothetical protein
MQKNRVEDKLVPESKLDVPATPHQSTVIDRPSDDTPKTDKPRAVSSAVDPR